MLEDVNVPGPLSPADHMVSPLDASGGVPIHGCVKILRKINVLKQVAKVEDLDSRCSMVLRLPPLKIHDTLDPSSPSLDPASPDFIQHVQDLSAKVHTRTPPDYVYVLDKHDDYHNAKTAYARELRA